MYYKSGKTGSPSTCRHQRQAAKLTLFAVAGAIYGGAGYGVGAGADG